jgi:ATP-dependent helicase/nuclease subunit B
MQRVFLDWQQPLLPAAADWSLQRARAQGRVDLSGEEHVLSGRRAARRYLDLLARRCDEQALTLDPPEVLAPGQWESLHDAAAAQRPSPLELECAFGVALAAAPRTVRSALALQDESLPALAQQWAELARELAEQGFDLRELVAALPVELPLPDAERERLAALSELARLAAALLARGGRAWPARASLAAGPSRIVLIGLVELPPLLAQHVRAQEDAIALVHAPPAAAARFDAYGRPLRAAWSSGLDFVDRLEVRVASDPAQQALQIRARLCELGPIPVDAVTIGLLDPQVERPLRAGLRDVGYELHAAEGSDAQRHPLCQALARLATLLRERSFSALSGLVRVPLVEARLREIAQPGEDPIAVLDRYASAHLPHGAVVATQHSREADAARPYLHWVARLTDSLPGGERELANWAPPLRRLLETLCGGERYEPSHPLGLRSLELLRAAGDALESFERLAAPLQPTVDAALAIELLLRALPDRLREPPLPNAIEAIGWLELAADDAPHLLVAGANEGYLPASAAPSTLPDSLRDRLGLSCDADREARDLYLLARMTLNRRTCTLFLARRDLAGKPLWPSRLLLRGEHTAIAPRLMQLLSSAGRLGGGATAQVEDRRIAAAPQLAPRPLQRLQISSIADWLSDPYRFHLARVLNLRELDANARELDAGAAGSLLHAVCDRFAREAPQLAGARAIEAWLMAALDERARAWFGEHPQPGVRVQIELFRQRLRAFARVQAQRRDDGWSILHSELTLSQQLEVDAMPIELVGRIDRIDRHESGAIQLLDIKTRNVAQAPRQSHCPNRAGEWTDLQLPLYLRLWSTTQANEAETAAGYLALPADSREAGVSLADWHPEELDDAWHCVQTVIRGIRSGTGLDVPCKPARGRRDPFALICRSEVFEEADE